MESGGQGCQVVGAWQRCRACRGMLSRDLSSETRLARINRGPDHISRPPPSPDASALAFILVASYTIIDYRWLGSINRPLRDNEDKKDLEHDRVN